MFPKNDSIKRTYVCAPSEIILNQHERRTYKVDHILSLFYSPLQPIYTTGHHFEQGWILFSKEVAEKVINSKYNNQGISIIRKKSALPSDMFNCLLDR